MRWGAGHGAGGWEERWEKTNSADTMLGNENLLIWANPRRVAI
jgi:hypothetical protein